MLAAAATSASAALPAYLEIEGETQGRIEGGVTQAGREGSIEVIAFDHLVYSPRDAASGLPTGKRQHGPVRVVKPIDKSTPLLANLLYNNENITSFRIRFFQTARSGAEQHYYTIELVNATVSSVRAWMPNTTDEATASQPVMEEVQFTYQKIITTIEDGGITAEDDWLTPRAATAPPNGDPEPADPADE